MGDSPKPYVAQIGAFLAPTQSLHFETLNEAAGWFFRQMAAYSALGVDSRNGRLFRVMKSGRELELAKFDFMADSGPHGDDLQP